MADVRSGQSPARESEAFPRSSQNVGGSQNPGQGQSSRGYGSSPDGSVTEKAADAAKDIGEEAKSLTKRVKDGAKEWLHEAGETAKDWARTAGGAAKDAAHVAGEKVDSARTSVGEGLESFGSGIRERGASASTIVGEKLEAAGTYLREHDFGNMADSMKDVVRRHPMPAVFVGIGLGFVLARAMRRG